MLLLACYADKEHGEMEKKDLITYCGLYCGLCSQLNRVPKQAKALQETLKKEGWESFGHYQKNFNEFWAFLNRLVDSENRCSCRKGTCGAPCGIKKCVQSKSIEMCPFCAEYPCERILGIAKGYPMMLADAKRMIEKGIDAWVEEQEDRRKTGFVYADIRYLPYEVADK